MSGQIRNKSSVFAQCSNFAQISNNTTLHFKKKKQHLFIHKNLLRIEDFYYTVFINQNHEKGAQKTQTLYTCNRGL